MTKHETNADNVFRRFGLEAPGLLGGLAVPPRSDGIGAGEKLKDALEQLGGIYLAFAEFLLWRSDLLGVDYLMALRKVRPDCQPVPRDTAVALIRQELGEKANEVVGEMETEPVWSTLSRTAWLSRYCGSTVVVQVAREPFPEAELARFEAGIRYLGGTDVRQVAAPEIIAEFRSWLRQAESCVTERSYLEVLGRVSGDTMVAYPVLIPEISTSRVLCWPWIEGETVSSLVRRGSVDAVTQVAMTVLEQFCSLSVVDAELDWDAMVLPEGGKRLAVRRVSRPLAIPSSQVNAGMKYLAAVLEGRTSLAVQTLVKLTVGKSTANLESSLLGLMSALEPELKVNLWFPESAAAFESNWQALAHLGVGRPLYLNCLHRNLMAVGYWTAEAVAAGGTAADTIADAHWPVVERMVKLNASRFLKPEVLTEWAVGLGLLGFGAVREANRFAEEVRDNNVTLEVDLGAGRKPARGHGGSSILRQLLIAGLLAALLFILRWGGTVSPGTQGILVVAGSVILVALFWAVARIR